MTPPPPAPPPPSPLLPPPRHPAHSRPRSGIYTQPRAAPEPPGTEAYSASYRPKWNVGGFKFLRRKKSTKRVLRSGNSAVAPFTPAGVSKKKPTAPSATQATPAQKGRHVSLSRRLFRYPLKALKTLRGDRLEEAEKHRDSKRVSLTLQLIQPDKPSRFSILARSQLRRARFLSRVILPRRSRSRRAKSRTQNNGQKRHKEHLLSKRGTVTRRPTRTLSKGKQREVPRGGKARPVIAAPRPLVDSTRACPDCHYSARLCLCDVTLSGVDKFGTVAYGGLSTYQFGSTTSLSSTADFSAVPPLSLADDRRHPRAEPSEGIAPLELSRKQLLPGDASFGESAWTDISAANTASIAGSGSISASNSSFPSPTAPLRLVPKPRASEPRNLHGVPSSDALIQLDDPFENRTQVMSGQQESRHLSTVYTLPPRSEDERGVKVTLPAAHQLQDVNCILLPPRPAYMDSRTSTKGGSSSPISSRSGSSARVSVDENVKRPSLAPNAPLPAAMSHSTIPSLWSRSSFDPDASNRAMYSSPSATLRSRLDEDDDEAADWTLCDVTASDHTCVGPPTHTREGDRTDDTPLIAESGFASDSSSDADDNSTRGLIVSGDAQGDVGLGLQLPSPASFPEQLRDRRRSDGLDQRRSGMCLPRSVSAMTTTTNTPTLLSESASVTTAGMPESLCRSTSSAITPPKPAHLSRSVSNATTTCSVTGSSHPRHVDSFLTRITQWNSTRMPTSSSLSRSQGRAGMQAGSGVAATEGTVTAEAQQRLAGLGLVLPTSESQTSMVSSRTIPSGVEVSSSALLQRLRGTSVDTTTSDWVESGAEQKERADYQASLRNPFCGIAEEGMVNTAPSEGREPEAARAQEAEGTEGREGLPEQALGDPFADFDGDHRGHAYIDVSPLLCCSSSCSSDESDTVSRERSETSPSASSEPASVPEGEPATSMTLPDPSQGRILFADELGSGEVPSSESTQGQGLLTAGQPLNQSCDSNLSMLQDTHVRPVLNLRSQESIEAFSVPPAQMTSSASSDPFNQFVQKQHDRYDEFVQATRYALATAAADSSSSLDQVGADDLAFDPDVYSEFNSGQMSEGDEQTPRAACREFPQDSDDPFGDDAMDTYRDSVLPPELQRSPGDIPVSPRTPQEVPRRRPRTPRRYRERRQLSLIWRDDEPSSSGPSGSSGQADTTYQSPTADLLDDYLSFE